MKAFIVIKENHDLVEYVDGLRDIVWVRSTLKEEAFPLQVDKVEISYPSLEDIVRDGSDVPIHFCLNGTRCITVHAGHGMILLDRYAQVKKASGVAYRSIPVDLFKIHHTEDYDIYLTVDLEELVNDN